MLNVLIKARRMRVILIYCRTLFYNADTATEKAQTLFHKVTFPNERNLEHAKPAALENETDGPGLMPCRAL